MNERYSEAHGGLLLPELIEALEALGCEIIEDPVIIGRPELYVIAVRTAGFIKYALCAYDRVVHILEADAIKALRALDPDAVSARHWKDELPVGRNAPLPTGPTSPGSPGGEAWR